MKHLWKFLFILLIGHLSFIVGHSNFVHAQGLLQYPIAELGYCRDAKECYLYCEIPEHTPACWSYGTYSLGPNVLGETTDSAEDKHIEDEAKSRGVSFPIGELGNCANVSACRAYCEQPTNQQACSTFAKKHGFKNQESSTGTVAKQKLLEYARTELGCETVDACRALCETDPIRCRQFASRYGEPKEQSRGDERGGQLLEHAKTELGCTSIDACRKICETDRERCKEFTQKYASERPDNAVKQLDSNRREQELKTRFPNVPKDKKNCDTEESCRTYCEEHPNECRGFSEQRKNVQNKSRYLGPSGCRTEAECKAYCQENPDKCPGFRPKQNYQNYPKPTLGP